MNDLKDRVRVLFYDFVKVRSHLNIIKGWMVQLEIGIRTL